MAIIDKGGFLRGQNSGPSLILEFGCGGQKKNPSAIGVDIIDTPCVDVVGDVYEVLSELNDGSVDAVQAYHFVEHLDDLPRFVRELERVMKPGGVMEFVAPHFSSPYFYSDPTHRSFFGLYTFCYFSASDLFSRRVPTYNSNLQIALERVDLVFKSSRPFFIRHGLKAALGLVFNSSRYMKEFYEENLCYFFPCYEVRYVLRRIA